MSPNKEIHPFAPVVDAKSRILILGSFPSVASRENQFYYGHPRNRFWPVIAACVKEDVPVTIEEKRDMLLRHGIALYDAAMSVEITGSMDHNLRAIVPADLSPILEQAEILQIFANGKKAGDILKRQNIPAMVLPSTSPANARASLQDLIMIWKDALEPYL